MPETKPTQEMVFTEITKFVMTESSENMDRFMEFESLWNWSMPDQQIRSSSFPKSGAAWKSCGFLMLFERFHSIGEEILPAAYDASRYMNSEMGESIAGAG